VLYYEQLKSARNDYCRALQSLIVPVEQKNSEKNVNKERKLKSYSTTTLGHMLLSRTKDTLLELEWEILPGPYGPDLAPVL